MSVKWIKHAVLGFVADGEGWHAAATQFGGDSWCGRVWVGAGERISNHTFNHSTCDGAKQAVEEFLYEREELDRLRFENKQLHVAISQCMRSGREPVR